MEIRPFCSANSPWTTYATSVTDDSIDITIKTIPTPLHAQTTIDTLSNATFIILFTSCVYLGVNVILIISLSEIKLSLCFITSYLNNSRNNVTNNSTLLKFIRAFVLKPTQYISNLFIGM